ncbi:hypothetical protein MPSEU_000039200 [Mayamaea pseudoterrestris]|nr:hypothetical protein MPSEU_000039200 [Mayamaea pseudoterrestris]
MKSSFNVCYVLLLPLLLSSCYRHLTVHANSQHLSNTLRNHDTSSGRIRTEREHNQHSLIDALKLGFCGGLGGAVGTLVLFPMDSAKTLRQANPSKYPSVQNALKGLIHTPAATPSTQSTWHVGRAYKGLVSSTIGAIPSSALYFGTYASVKRHLHRRVRKQQTDNHDLTFPQRFFIHALAAASGNLASSAIFVPKELLKQQMQYTGQNLGSTLATLWSAAASGASAGASRSLLVKEPVIAAHFVNSLYRGWQTTLLRNIPSAILRFCIYEELKRAVIVSAASTPRARTGGQMSTNGADDHALPSATAVPVRIFLAGALAGALASGLMTPFDVLRTRVSTGTCPVDIPACVNLVVTEQGLKGLYAGAGSRMAFSGAFSAIGFGTYEMAKVWLNVSDDDSEN